MTIAVANSSRIVCWICGGYSTRRAGEETGQQHGQAAREKYTHLVVKSCVDL